MAVRADWSARALGVDGCAAENFCQILGATSGKIYLEVRHHVGCNSFHVAKREKAMRGRNLVLRFVFLPLGPAL